jgi:hypothetical protein
MDEKIIDTVFMATAVVTGVFFIVSPLRVAQIVGASAKWRESMNLVLWRILGFSVAIGCLTRLIGIWFLGWST